MVIKVAGKEVEVRFGIRFIRELDKKCEINSNGVKLGAGLEMNIPMLQNFDTLALSDVLYAGTCTEKKRPYQSEIDDFVENHENLEELFDEVLSELKNSNATRLKVKKMLEVNVEMNPEA